jgi:dGTPase
MDLITVEDVIEYRRIAQEREEQWLYPKAALSKEHARYGGKEEDHRLPYKRDVDRIIHSKAYARYADKTQVVYLVANDHIAHRGLHVQLVSNFARGIAEILRFNLDLVEAIALGHDVGHPPFGHEGEGYLSNLSLQYNHQAFAHPLQSCRLFTEIEPLNLGLAVYDGFLCHDGGLSGTRLVPQFGKSWEQHFRERELRKKDPEINIMPATLEGCLVKICDTISYLGRDIEDAIHLGIIKRTDIPKTVLGNSNKEILNYAARDIIRGSYERDYIAISQEVFDAIQTLRQFNFQSIYKEPKLKTESSRIKKSYELLFTVLLEDLEKNGEKSHIGSHFLHNKNSDYLKNSSVQKVIDYIAGMTDSFFIRTLETLYIPKRIELC